MTIDAKGVDILKEITDIDFVENQKISRVLHAICVKYGINQHPEYNRVFAKLSASINPLRITL